MSGIIPQNGRASGVNVIAVDIPLLRPQDQPADSFEELAISRQASKQQVVWMERNESVTTTNWAGSDQLAEEVIKKMDELDELSKDAEANAKAIAEKRLQVEQTLRQGGGQAAQIIGEAERDRWVSLMTARAKASELLNQIPQYRAAPELYKQRRIMEVYPRHKVVVDAFTGNYGCALAIGEGQSAGNHMSYGGPHYGFMAARNEHIRRLPGRIVGETHDLAGKRGYVLTLQTREQHIRREKATSNITTNQTLLALAGLAYLCWLGPEGLGDIGRACLSLAALVYTQTARAETTPAPTTSASSTMTKSTTAGTTGSRPARKHLPRTASSLALFELISGLSLAGGVAVRQLRARLS
jgi:hypothetical protein